MQATGVQIVRLEIGSGHKADTVVEQRHQQPVQDHRVRDVRHMELIKTNEFVAFGDALAQHVQRIDRALEGCEFAMDFTHEFVKVQAHLALQGNGVEKAFHQKALAPPHPAIHVHAARHIRPVDQLLECVGTLGLVCGPVISATLKGIHCAQLGRVTLVAFSGQLGQVSLFNSHVVDAQKL